MKPKVEIEDLLNNLNCLYDSTTDVKHQEIYSKIALLELCGWLEMAFDEIVLSYTTSKLTDNNNIKYLNKVIVHRVNSFEYSKFREMLIQIVGIINVEKLEKLFDVERLESELGDGSSGLVKNRNTLAHTTSAGVMRSIDAPSITISKLNTLYPILKKIEQELGNI